MEDRFNYRAAVYLILEREGRYLLLCRKGTGFGDGMYNLPAGHADGGETMAQAAAREGLEELGIVIEEQDMKLVHMSHRPYHSAEKAEVFDFFFTADKWRGEIHNMEPHKCSELKWCTLEELPPSTMPYIKDALWSVMSGQELGLKSYPLNETKTSAGQ